MSKSLELEVLGPLRLLIDGRPVELGPSRRRTLLAALAVDADQTVSLDTLADRVWDGEPPAAPAATLQAYVSRLRTAMRSFDADGVERTAPLLTVAPGYRLAVGADAVDATRFASGVGAAREALTAGDLGAADRAVREALALWRGEAYADIPADFARREAHRLAGQRLDALELKARVDLAAGRHAALVAEVTALLEADPMRESLHAVLVLALYRSGRQADALRQLDEARRLIADELGLDPGPDLRRLQDQILRQDPALDLDPVASPGVDASAAEPAVRVPLPPAASLTSDPMHGREAELGRLEALLDDVEQGRAASFVVTGEAGIGKTRVLEEMVALAGARGMVSAWGRCWAHEGAPVLWPWVQALESLAEQTPRDELVHALQGAGAGVTALAPTLAELAPAGAGATGAAGGVGSEPARVRLYDGVARFLTQLSTTRPLLLVLEDMHWADLASRELAEYLASTVRTARVGVAVSVRAPTEEHTRSGAELLTSLARSGRTQRVDLGGLSREAVNAYVTERTGSVLDDATSAALLDRTGGNPFFVGELVRLLITDLDASRATDIARAVPDGVREVIARRLERLPDIDQSVLRVAAVVGRTFDLDLIEAVSSLDEDAVDDSIDRATEFGIIRSDPDDPRRHRFVHALTQQTLLETTGPAKVRRLHGRVGAILSERSEGVALTPALAERLAYHLTQSGGPDEIARAIDLCIETADTAMAQGNYPESESLLLRALDLIGRLGLSAEAREMTARVRLWSLYTVINGPRTPEAVGQHERALELIGRHGGAREILAGHQALFSRLIWTDDLEGVESLVVEMTAAAEAADDDLMRLAAHLARGQLLTHRGRLDEALAELALGFAHKDAAADAPVGVFPLEADSALYVWQLVAATPLDREAEIGSSRRFVKARLIDGPPVAVAYLHTMLAFAHAVRDEPATAQAHADAAADLMHELGLLDGLVFLTPVRAWATERAAPGSALEDIVNALAASEVLPSFALRPTLRGFAADVLLRAGRVADANAMVEAALAESQLTGDRYSLVELHRLHALTLAAARAEDAEVVAALDAGQAALEEQGCVLFRRRLEATRASFETSA